MNNTDGDTVSDIEGMCGVFAKFYEDLYSECGSPATEPSRLGSATDDPQFVTPEELLVVMKSMKNNKTGAADGLVAEMLKTEHRGLLLAICDFFNDIIAFRLESPMTWKLTKLKLIFKSG